MKTVVKDADEEDADFDEQWHVARVCQVIDRVRGLWKEHQKAVETLDAKVSAETKRKCVIHIKDSKRRILDALEEMRLKKKPIDKIVLTLKEFVVRLDRANRDIAELLAGVPDGVPEAAFDPAG